MSKRCVAKRVYLTLPDGIVEDLERWAEAEGNKAASLAGFIVEQAVRTAKQEGKIPPAADYATLRDVLRDNLETLVTSGKFTAERLQALMQGTRPTEVEILRIALLSHLTEEMVSHLANV